MLEKVHKKIQQEKDKIDKKRFDEVMPHAVAIIKMISESDLKLGDYPQDDMFKHYSPIAEKIMNYCSEHNLRYVDVKGFMFFFILQPFQQIQSIFENMAQNGYSRSVEKLYGCDIMDLRLQQIDSTLKS